MRLRRLVGDPSSDEADSERKRLLELAAQAEDPRRYAVTQRKRYGRLGSGLIWLAAGLAGAAALTAALSAANWLTATVAGASAALSFLELKLAPSEKIAHANLEIAVWEAHANRARAAADRDPSKRADQFDLLNEERKQLLAGQQHKS
jgi:hypothetical protein